LLALAETGGVGAGVGKELYQNNSNTVIIGSVQGTPKSTIILGSYQLGRYLIVVAVVDQFDPQVATGIYQVAEDSIVAAGVHEHSVVGVEGNCVASSGRGAPDGVGKAAVLFVNVFSLRFWAATSGVV